MKSVLKSTSIVRTVLYIVHRIMERVFDVENDRILLKFHREGGQLFCKTVEFLVPRGAAAAVNQTSQPHNQNSGAKVGVTLDDCKVNC